MVLVNGHHRIDSVGVWFTPTGIFDLVVAIIYNDLLTSSRTGRCGRPHLLRVCFFEQCTCTVILPIVGKERGPSWHGDDSLTGPVPKTLGPDRQVCGRLGGRLWGSLSIAALFEFLSF